MKHLSIGITTVLMLIGASGAAQAVPAGSLDPTFSHDGIARSGLLANDHPSIVQVDSKERVLVGGFDANLHEALVIRYSATGSPDKTWGHRYLPYPGGVIGLSMSGANVVVGLSDGVVSRLTPSGSLDQTFGVRGYVETNGAVGLPSSIVALGVNAKAIYVLGENGPGDAVLFRIALDGKSYITRPLCIGARYFSASCGDAYSMTVSPSFVYVGGAAGVDGGPSNFSGSAVVGRVKPNGTIDATYGDAGYAFLDTCGDCNNGSSTDALAVSPSSGQVVAVGGYCAEYCAHDGDPFVAWFTSAGTLLSSGSVSFGDCGNSCDGGGTDTYVSAVTLQAGKAIIVGTDTACDGQDVSCLGMNSGHVSAISAGGSSVRVLNNKIVIAGGQYVERFRG